MNRITAIAALVLLVAAVMAVASVPQMISYQGVLTDGAGTAVPDGTYDLTFKIYDVPSGGTALWTETQAGVQVTGGVFNVYLGAVNPLALPFDATYYLGVGVNGGAELAPRTMLTASPYSLNSQAVKGTSNVFPDGGNVGVGTTSPSAPLEVKFDNTVANKPAISIDNSSGPSGQDVIGFKFSGALQASLRKPNGGDLFITSSSGIRFQSSNTNRMKINFDGNVGIGTDSPIELLDVAGGLRIGNTANSNAGTIRWTGSDFEGYDGSSWKSLTAAGGSLPSGSSGQTLRHNGSGWTATSNLYNNGTNVGIGTTTPDAPLDIAGGNWDLVNTDGDLKIGNDTYKLKIGVATGGGGAGTAGIRMQGGLQRIILGGGSQEVMQIDTTGTVSIGSTTLDGVLDVYANGVPGLEIGNSLGYYGGSLRTKDRLGNITAFLEPDFDGSGGFLAVYRNPSNMGFEVDGNYLGSNSTRVMISGAAKSAVFDMSSTDGDGSVLLPNDAVSSVEIKDEPGAASATEGIAAVVLDGSYQTLLARTITAPASGYVLVLGTCQPYFYHTNGTASSAEFGVSDAAGSLPTNQDVLLQLNQALPTGSYYFPVTVHGLFSVTQGIHTFYLIARETSGLCDVYDMQLSLLYIPTAYGTVTPTLASAQSVPDDQAGTKALTEADMAREREESIAANAARIERELAEMQARIKVLEQELKDGQK